MLRPEVVHTQAMLGSYQNQNLMTFRNGLKSRLMRIILNGWQRNEIQWNKIINIFFIFSRKDTYEHKKSNSWFTTDRIKINKK